MAKVTDAKSPFPIPPPNIEAIIACRDDARPNAPQRSFDQLVQEGATLQAWIERQDPMVQGLMAPAYVGTSCTARRLRAAAEASAACNSFKVCNPFMR